MAACIATRPVEMLLVEDDPGDVRLTQEALKDGKMIVHLNVARDGVEAMDFLRRRMKFADSPTPDIILLDLNLPRMSGSEVLKEIKTDPTLRRIPVLVMTTSRAHQDVQNVYSLNANCYITKPLNLDEFLAVMKSIEDFWLRTVTLPEARPA